MSEAFVRPFRPVELTASTLTSFPLQAMAQQLMTEDAFPTRGFLPKLFRLQSNSPRRHDMLNDHPRFLHHDAIDHQLQYLLLHLEGRLLKRPTHTGTKCFNPFKQAHLIFPHSTELRGKAPTTLRDPLAIGQSYLHLGSAATPTI